MEEVPDSLNPGGEGRRKRRVAIRGKFYLCIPSIPQQKFLYQFLAIISLSREM